MSRARREKKPRSRWLTWLVLLAAGIAALLYECGAGLGIGLGTWSAGGEDSSPQSERPVAALADAAVEPPCQLRLDARGLRQDNRRIAPKAAAKACRDRGAVLTITGDARYGDVETARSTLREAGVDLVERLPE